MSAGTLRELVTFQSRTYEDDGGGGTIVGWADVATVPARILTLRGTETVMAARLEGRQTIAITVRAQPALGGLTSEWRAFDTRQGLDDNDEPRRAFNIRSVERDERGAFIEILTETGVVQ